MPADDFASDPSAELARLQAELAVALEAAEIAEREQGRLQGELTETRNEWAAANFHQQEWDHLLSEHLEELRLCRERLTALEEQHQRVLESTSWRVIQGALAPYRRLRSRRG